MTITPIPAFKDNYIWAIQNDVNEVFVVDPGDAVPVEEFLTHNQLTLSGILITHHHADHTGGLADLCMARNIPVYGPSGGHIKGITHPVRDSDEIHVFGHKLIVMAVPGHTLDHIAYYMPADTPSLFCGDTLFAGGCGRLFEGTAEMMYTSLRQIEALPGSTQIYCAHEYTLNNLAFAQRADPDNAALTERIKTETDKRRQGLPTLPSSILLEQRTNPFLRCHTDSLQANVGRNMAQSLHSEIETFAALRRWKDQG
ncbi:MAG: hydroxyacylglutathione hydrolase [Pseudohongiella sp.]|nr:hydroxyacylglutathione hydrolase [Pseudohongiella sp.]MDO9519781.1 hydroxyacylglutathione hydrolase [Pseudohongiella sp.]